jgi:hypothetical protein
MTWKPPSELPDLQRVDLIAIDTETKDDCLAAGKGSSWPVRQGFLCGLSVAPRHAFTARAAGTRKSMLVDIAASHGADSITLLARSALSANGR